MSNLGHLNEGSHINNLELVMLHEFSLILNSTHMIDQILKKSASKINTIMQSDGCHIILSRQLRDKLKLETAIHDGGKPFPPGADPTNGKISLASFEKQQIIIVTDAENDPRVTPKFQKYLGHKSMVSVPMIVKEKTIGVVVIYSKCPAKYNHRDGYFLLMLGSHLGLAIENANLMQELKKSAITDPLTGAYNYRFFRHKVESIIHEKTDTSVALIMIDLNKFKEVNDVYGHLAGDFILKELTTLFKQNIRKNDYVARIGGDEFIIILPGLDEEEVNRIAVRIEKEVAKYQFVYDGCKIKTSISWGAFRNECSNTIDINEIVSLVDQRLYEMKKA